MIALSIAMGGAFGALARFWVNQFMIANSLSAVGLSTLTVNVAGSFAIGCCFVIFERFSASDALRLGLMVGFLGAFTTFSTFSLELVSDLQAGNFLRPAMYAAGSVMFCLFACYAGIAVARSIID
ncbi:MAG: fluoride efflux transporter CrcB [Halieaceae bacterium]|jgi:CrcB protein